MWPQYVYLCLMLLGLGVVLAKHGEPQKNYNIWASLFADIIILGLLYFGGFFKGLF